MAEFSYDPALVAPFIAEAQKRRLAKPFLAYVLATAWHETGGKLLPVTESLNYSAAALKRKKKYFTAAEAEALGRTKTHSANQEAIANKMYSNRIGNGDEASGDGWKYRGRGYVQITGRRNYAEMSVRCGVDMVANPDLALDHKTSMKILFEGMVDGTFTGSAMRRWIKPGVMKDYVSCRRVVNGTDKADLIAGYAGRFEGKLEGYNPVADSKTVKAAQSSSTASTVGALASAGAVVKGIIDAVDNPSDLVEVAQQGAALARIIPWLGTGAAVIFVGIFVYQRTQAKKIEAERLAIAERGG